MCTTQFRFISYNCHLFPNPDNIEKWNIGTWYFMDPQREKVIRQYLESVTPYSSTNPVIQVAALQEIWGRGYADDITGGTNKHRSYTNSYYISAVDCVWYVVGAPISLAEPVFCTVVNPSGLVLLADPVCQHFRDAQPFDYISHCTLSGDGWSVQDLGVAKGFLRGKLDYVCADGDKHALLVFTTHMPTNYGSHTSSLECCYDYLTSEIKSFQASETKFATVVLGDFNINYFDQTPSLNINGVPTSEYDDAITNRLLNGTGLVDAAAAAPGHVSIDPSTNTLWKRFNPNSGSSPAREDYFFYANSVDGSMKISVDSIDAITTGLTVQDDSGDTYNCSDHFPLETLITVSVND